MEWSDFKSNVKFAEWMEKSAARSFKQTNQPASQPKQKAIWEKSECAQELHVKVTLRVLFCRYDTIA